MSIFFIELKKDRALDLLSVSKKKKLKNFTLCKCWEQLFCKYLVPGVDSDYDQPE